MTGSTKREILSQEPTLAGVTGMIEVAKGVDVLAERVRELETEAKGIETTIKEGTKAMEKIDYLLSKAKHRTSEPMRADYEAIKQCLEPERRLPFRA